MSKTTDSVLEQYDKASQSSNSGTNRMPMEERMKKYFAAILAKDEKSAQKRIRILPTADGSSPFIEAYFHEVQVDGKWVKLYDPGMNDNERSPLTEVYDELIATGKETDKKLAIPYKVRKFYVVKLIDRDNEADGVKFWRFKHNYKKEGVLDKIIPIWKSKGDITDVKEGRDLIIELSKSKSPNGKEYTIIQTIMFDDKSPLHEKKSVMEEWLSDELTWRDVYSKKGIEYLEAVARGETPKWDNNAGKYVFGNSVKDETSIGGEEEKYEDPQETAEPDDDLPF